MLSTWVHMRQEISSKAPTLKVPLPTGSREGQSGSNDELRGLNKSKQKFFREKQKYWKVSPKSC